jgi:hypothetical protein
MRAPVPWIGRQARAEKCHIARAADHAEVMGSSHPDWQAAGHSPRRRVEDRTPRREDAKAARMRCSRLGVLGGIA